MRTNRQNPMKRPCRRCGEIFKPTGKFEKLCNKCNKNLRRSSKK